MTTTGDAAPGELTATLVRRSSGDQAAVYIRRLIFDGDRVKDFTEKPQIGEGWINGGFMVLEPGIFSYLNGDDSSLEADALEHLAVDGQLVAMRHDRFWQCMDTLRDVRLLEELWREDRAPWKTWE